MRFQSRIRLAKIGRKHNKARRRIAKATLPGTLRAEFALLKRPKRGHQSLEGMVMASAQVAAEKRLPPPTGSTAAIVCSRRRCVGTRGFVAVADFLLRVLPLAAAEEMGWTQLTSDGCFLTSGLVTDGRQAYFFHFSGVTSSFRKFHCWRRKKWLFATRFPSPMMLAIAPGSSKLYCWSGI